MDGSILTQNVAEFRWLRRNWPHINQKYHQQRQRQSEPSQKCQLPQSRQVWLHGSPSFRRSLTARMNRSADPHKKLFKITPQRLLLRGGPVVGVAQWRDAVLPALG